MPKLRNFEQLLFVKQLYEDSKSLVTLADTLSLTKSLILVDLAIEQTLKTVILNLNPSFYIPRGKKDILWKDLWKEADDLIKKTVPTGLIEEVECTGLRELRNLVQHRGMQPTNVDVRRAVESAEKMLIQTFLDAFNINFKNLRRWDFIDNLSLRNLLLESEFFLEEDDPLACIVGCSRVRNYLVKAVFSETVKEKFSNYPSTIDLEREFKKTSLVRYFRDLEKYYSSKINIIENEVVFVGLGMPILDSRKFIEFSNLIHSIEAYSGDIKFLTNSRGEDLETLKIKSDFMLNFLFRLLSLTQEKNSELLNTIEVKIPISKQITKKLTNI